MLWEFKWQNNVKFVQKSLNLKIQEKLWENILISTWIIRVYRILQKLPGQESIQRLFPQTKTLQKSNHTGKTRPWFWQVNFIWQPKSALVGTNCCKWTLILKTLEIFCLLERWKWWWWFVVALLEGNVPCLINISMWSTRMSCMYVKSTTRMMMAMRSLRVMFLASKTFLICKCSLQHGWWWWCAPWG